MCVCVCVCVCVLVRKSFVSWMSCSVMQFSGTSHERMERESREWGESEREERERVGQSEQIGLTARNLAAPDFF